MGNFFTSPQQRAGQTMYDAATSGHPIGGDIVNRSYASGLESLRANAANISANQAGDILSRNASAGIAGGSSVEGEISKNNQNLYSSEQGGELSLYSDMLKELAGLTNHQLGLGLSTMSSSSTFGDILGGLTTLTNVGSGVGKLLLALKNPAASAALLGTGGQSADSGVGKDMSSYG
jgi:hypothetical protein